MSNNSQSIVNKSDFPAWHNNR